MSHCKWCSGPLHAWFGVGGKWALCWKCDTAVIAVLLPDGRTNDVIAGPPRLLRNLKGGMGS